MLTCGSRDPKGDEEGGNISIIKATADFTIFAGKTSTNVLKNARPVCITESYKVLCSHQRATQFITYGA